MWVVEGLTRRYPTKALAELLSTCPQYCGHCTRMDLVGTSTPQSTKTRLALQPVDRQEAMLDYLKRTPSVRDVVVSGGDVANVPWPQLEAFLIRLLEIDSSATSGWPPRRSSACRSTGSSRRSSRRHGAGGRHRPRAAAVNLAVHTHVNHATRSPRWSPRRRAPCSTPACATCATRAC